MLTSANLKMVITQVRTNIYLKTLKSLYIDSNLFKYLLICMLTLLIIIPDTNVCS